MLSRTFRFGNRFSALPAAPRTASIPRGQRIFAIGDIHGRLDLLETLISRIDEYVAQAPPLETHIIFLGDLIDRGPDSAGVIDRVMSLARERQHVRTITGNHEEVFLRALGGEPEAMRFLVRMGGMKTVLSYGVTLEEYNRGSFEDLIAILCAHVPEAHVDFLSSCEDMIVVGDYAFVHAGVAPGIDLEAQSRSDLRWIRRPFLEHAGDFGRIVVHGHSITDEIDERPNRIGIDTGAYMSGRLTALALEEDRRWYIST